MLFAFANRWSRCCSRRVVQGTRRRHHRRGPGLCRRRLVAGAADQEPRLALRHHQPRRGGGPGLRLGHGLAGRQRLRAGLGAAVLSLLVALFAWRFLRESRTGRRRRAPPRPARPPAARRSRTFSPAGTSPRRGSSGSTPSASAAFYGTIQIVPLLLADRLGSPSSTVGYFVMYLGGMGVVVRALVLGRAVDRLGEARLVPPRHRAARGGLAATGLAHAGAAARRGIHPHAPGHGLSLSLRHRPALPAWCRARSAGSTWGCSTPSAACPGSPSRSRPAS